MKKTTEKTNVVMVESLVYNNRFASLKLDGDQIGVENFAQWKTLVTALHRAAYKAYVTCENSGMLAESTSIDKTEIFDAIRGILGFIGEVNSHKLVANAETAIAMIGYSGRRGNVDAPELQFCNSRLSNATRELKKYLEMNVTDADHKAQTIASMEQTIATLEAERDTLLKTADMRHKAPTMTAFNTFRLDVEHYFARVISGQLAKTLEELDAEAEARRVARNERAKARKANKTK